MPATTPVVITPLVNAIDRLREGLARHQRQPADDQLRDGLIQRFEFTYELSHPMLRRFIRQTAASPEDVDRMAFQDLIHTTNQQGLLLGDWPAWHRYRDSRAKTGYAYHAKTAQEVAESIPDFLAEAEYLRDELRKRLTVTKAIDLSQTDFGDRPRHPARPSASRHARLGVWLPRNRLGSALFRP